MMAYILVKDEKFYDICDLIQHVKKTPQIAECGAIYSFEGIVRGKEPGKTTQKMKLSTPLKDKCQKELEEIILRSGTGLNPRKNFTLGKGKNFYITIKNVKNGKIRFD